MATYTDQTLEHDASAEDIKTLMVEKATELFNLCDREQKGFITKRDMQRLQQELPLSPEQLEDVFDSLDDDGNGFLTLEEFTDGFGSFLGFPSAPVQKQISQDSTGSVPERVYENENSDSADDEEHFNELVDHLGANEVLDDMNVVKDMWGRLRKDEPELLGTFEEFLGKVTLELKRRHADYENLETALRTKSSAHDEEVRRLYEEMEQQIRLEKDRVMTEEKARERQIRDDLERDLYEKDRQIQEMMNKHHEMQKKLEILNAQEAETKQENELLMKEREELESMLDESQLELDESRSYITQLRQQQRDDKRERALAALQISEGIAMERESLVKQLDMLRDVNKKLRDDRDEAELKRAYGGETAPAMYGADSIDREEEEDDKENTPASFKRGANARSSNRSNQTSMRRKRQMSKQGSIMSSYFSGGSNSSSRRNSLVQKLNEPEEDDLDIEVEAVVCGHGSSYYGMPAAMATESLDAQNGHFDEVDSGVNMMQATHASNEDVQEMLIEPEMEILPSASREQPVGANSSPLSNDHNSMTQQEIESASPERVFKVVFVGDSGVGKSSFIHRFCSNQFKATFSATIGVDFQIKNIKVENHIIALQLWDTAGQERFRSITKQYFRKADGVLIMYDVTSEASFKNVVNWMTSVQEGTEEDTVLLLAGNKMDLVEDENCRVVKMKDGSRLADEYGALFYETSSKTGVCVKECMEAMASVLSEREDKAIEKALNLADESEKKRGCCS